MSDLKFSVPRHLLSSNKILRREFLDGYFSSSLIPFEQEVENQWEITAFSPAESEFYVDPNLDETLKSWQHPVSVCNLGNYRSFYKNSMISFFDSWSLYYWSLLSCYLSKTGENVQSKYALIHVDDHKDLSSPLIVESGAGYKCLLSKENFIFLDPNSVELSIRKKSIGIDSFITPLIWNTEKLEIFHIRYKHLTNPENYNIKLFKEPDSLLSPEELRFKLELNENPSTYSYSIGNNNFYFKNKINKESLILLHIDCDAFINRYNLDMNWNSRSPTPQLSLEEVRQLIHQLTQNIAILANPVFVNIALSPGFFPSEYWVEICDFLIECFENSGIIRNDGFSEFLLENYPDELRYEIKSG